MSTPPSSFLSEISCGIEGSASVSVEAAAPAKNKGGRPRVYATNADRQAAYDARKRGEVVEKERLAEEASARNEDALNHAISGGYDARALSIIEGADFRNELPTLEGNPAIKHEGKELAGQKSEKVEYSHKHATSPVRRVRPSGAAPPKDEVDIYEVERKENPETDSTFAPTHAQLMAQGEPLPRKGRGGFLESVKRAFCKTHSLVELGTSGETFIDFTTTPPSRVLLFATHFDVASRTWKLGCGCERPKKDFHHRRYYKPKESENE